MNLIIVDDNDFIDPESISLNKKRISHLISNQESSLIGKTLLVGRFNEKIGKGEIVSVKEKNVFLNVFFDTSPPPPLSITVIISLPRPKIFKKILQSLTTLGVKEIFFIESWKVDKSYWLSKELKEDKIRKNIIIGLEQGKDTIPPAIKFRKKFKPFAEDELPTIINDKLPLLALPKKETSFNYSKQDLPATIVIGPEGGFTEYEISKLKGLDFNTVSLGPRTLRVENATIALLAKFL